MTWQQKLAVGERIVVIIAAIAALFPLWQFWNEQEDRRIDRAANFILAFTTCSDVESPISQDWLAPGWIINSDFDIPPEVLIDPPAEMGERWLSILEQYEATREDLAKGINVECDYIREKNEIVDE